MRPKKIQPTFKPQPVNLYKKIAICFVVLTGLLILFVFYLSFGQAKIVVTPARQAVDVDFIADLIPKEEAQAAEVPGRIAISGVLDETTVGGSKEYEATGSKIAESENVGGKVTIINNYNKAQPLVATTRLLSPEGILFRIKNRVNVPAGGKVEVEVYADPPTAEAANLGPTHFTIPGLWPALQDKIYGESYEKMSGGKQEVKFVTQTDLDSAYADLTKSLSEKVIEDSKKEMESAGEILGKVLITEILDKKNTAAVGDEKDKFTVTLKFKAVGVVFYRMDLESLAITQLQGKLPEGQKLANVDLNNLSFVIEKYDLKEKTANVSVHLAGEAVLKTESKILDKNNLAGLGKEDAVKYLTSFPEIQSAEINLSPFWVRKIPKLKDHIEVTIKK
jgi:hypothetical protein